MRSASDSPSRPMGAKCLGGVPQAGQPSTPNTVTRWPGSSRRSASPRAPTGAWSSITRTWGKRRDELCQPFAVDAVEPRHVDDGDARYHALRAARTEPQSLVQQHRAVGEEDRIAPRRAGQSRSRLRAGTPRRSSIRRGEGPIASRIATFSSASSTAKRRRARGLRCVRRLHDRHAREGREQGDVAEATGATSRARPG